MVKINLNGSHKEPTKSCKLVVLVLSRSLVRWVLTHILEIPLDCGISSTFNVEDLVQFQGSTTMPSNPSVNLSESEPEPKNSIIPKNPIPPEIHACHE